MSKQLGSFRSWFGVAPGDRRQWFAFVLIATVIGPMALGVPAGSGGAMALAVSESDSFVAAQAGDAKPPTSNVAAKAKADAPKTKNAPSSQQAAGNAQSDKPPAKEAAPPKTEVASAKKHAVPSQAEQKAAEKNIRKLLHEDLAAARTRERNLGLARSLLKLGAKTENDPVFRYVLFQMAQEQATTAGNLAVAMEAIDKLAAEYDVDAWPRRVSTLNRIIETARRTRGAMPWNEGMSQAATTVLDQAMGADEYGAARQVIVPILSAARRAKNAAAVRELAKRDQDLRRLEEGFAAFQAAQKALADDPADASANLTAGRWNGFVKGQWEKALPLLAKGGDVILAQLAEDDLKQPAQPDLQVELARAWWQQCLKEKVASRSHAARRAVFWYDRALAKLSGAAKLEVSRHRLDALAVVGDPNSPDVAGAIEEGNVALASNGTRISAGEELKSPDLLLDGTAIEPASLKCPGALTIVLPKLYRLQEIQLHLYAPEAYFQGYSLATSSDGLKYTPLVDRSDGNATGLQRLRFSTRSVKAFTLVALSARLGSSKAHFQINEIECYCVPPDIAAGDPRSPTK